MSDRRTLPGRLPENALGAVTVATVGLLGLVVSGVGVVAVFAELVNTWDYYFLMERAVAVASPVATVLAGLTVLTGFAAVAVAARKR